MLHQAQDSSISISPTMIALQGYRTETPSGRAHEAASTRRRLRDEEFESK
jgi:hypothetical protein